MGWEIALDSDTEDKYNRLGRDDIKANIKNGEICLTADGRCPFLEKSGLCRLITELGEDYTSLICREHPRFYHRIGDRVECGIGLSCEEAARVVLSSDLYSEFYESEHTPDVAEETDFDSLTHRSYIYGILSDDSLSYNEKTDRIKQKYSLEKEIYSDDKWREIFYNLEYLNESHRGLFTFGSDKGTHKEVYIRFLAYLVFRHLSVAENYDNLRARLGFCLLLTRLLEEHRAKEATLESLCDFARIISEEIEYSEDNTASLIFEFEVNLE